MQYTYNGEIKCNKEDSEKVLAYIREIFPFPISWKMESIC